MPLYEFTPSFIVDQTDLSLTAKGSGVHLNKVVNVNLGILDRASGGIGDNRDFLANPYVNNVSLDILNIDGTVKFQDFLTNYKSNAFSITEYDNINVFGEYTKDFGVKATVSESSQTNTAEFYFYGNVPEFSGITVRDSTGTTSHSSSQSSKTAVNASGQTGVLTSTVTFNNDSNYISFDRLEIYSSTGSAAFNSQIDPNPVFAQALSNETIQSFDINEGELPSESGVYLHFVPYGQLGTGEVWTVGPYTFKDNPPASNPYITEITSGDITGALGFTPSSSSGGVRTVIAAGETLDASETLNFGFGGSNIKVTESAGAVTIAVDGSSELPTAIIPLLDASKINGGTFANAQISQSNVTQHQAALTLASGQITGALGFTPISAQTDDQTLDEVLAQGNTSSRHITAGGVTGSNGVRGQDVQIGVTDSATIDTSAGNLDIGSAGGTTILGDSTISVTNKLGIGTTNPVSKLTVESTANALTDADEPENYHLLLRNPANDNAEGVGMGFLVSDATNDVGAAVICKRISTNAQSELQFWNKQNTTADGAITQSMTIDKDGKVGIGTTSPDYLLDIGGDTGSADNTIRMVQANGGTAIRIGAGGGSNDVTLLRVDGATSINKGESNSSNFGFSLRYKGSGTGAGNALSVLADNSGAASQVEALTILNDGKIGMGTTSPGQKLHVYQGTAKFESTDGNDESLQLGRSDNSNLWRFNHAGNDLRIYNSGGSGYDVLFGVNSGGASQSNKVGINTASPSTALHVEGTITHKVYTVAALPSASPAGQRSFVSDASSVLDVNLGATVSAGGSNLVPVFSDGSNWIVG